jgi:NitT/TauT family transport system permease protein
MRIANMGEPERIREVRPSRERLSAVAYPTLAFAALIILWDILVRTLRIPEFILPTPSQVLAVFTGDRFPIWRHAATTLVEIVLGFFGAILIGGALAIAIALWKPFEQAIYPLLVSTQAVPKLAIAPLFVIWVGFGMEGKVAIAVLVAFFPIVIDTVTGLRSAPSEMIYLARSMGANRWDVFRFFILPNALPHIFSGFKVAITLAVSGAIVGEFVGADKGLGYVILLATGKMQTDLVFAAIMLLACIGILMFYAVLLAERLALPWHVSMRKGGLHGGA